MRARSIYLSTYPVDETKKDLGLTDAWPIDPLRNTCDVTRDTYGSRLGWVPLLSHTTIDNCHVIL